MKVVIQRVEKASVKVNEDLVGCIEKGLLLLIGIAPNDQDTDLEYCLNKIINLRIFNDDNNKMNLSIKDINGALLCVSQFTLFANTQKGNRPSFINSANPELANSLYQRFILKAQEHIGKDKVEQGIFGANMQVSLLNDGPVTIILDSKQKG